MTCLCILSSMNVLSNFEGKQLSFGLKIVLNKRSIRSWDSSSAIQPLSSRQLPTRRQRKHLSPRSSVCCLRRRREDSGAMMFQQMVVISARLSNRAQALPVKTWSLWGRLSILSKLRDTVRNTLYPGGNQCYGNEWEWCDPLRNIPKCTEGWWWKSRRALWGMMITDKNVAELDSVHVQLCNKVMIIKSTNNQF